MNEKGAAQVGVAMTVCDWSRVLTTSKGVTSSDVRREPAQAEIIRCPGEGWSDASRGVSARCGRGSWIIDFDGGRDVASDVIDDEDDASRVDVSSI